MSEQETRKEAIDYTAEGADPGKKQPLSDTDRGYDEAAHSGSGYGVPEGEGGVFGTTGGGTYGGGMQIVEGPLVYEKKEEKPWRDAATRRRGEGATWRMADPCTACPRVAVSPRPA